jgi:hypothetical protein
MLPAANLSDTPRYPKKPQNVQLAATAQQLAITLRQQDGESDIEWGDRIREWVRKNGRGWKNATGYGESFRTIRRQLLPGSSANVALCEVRTATQSHWPIGLKRFASQDQDSLCHHQRRRQ